MNLHDTLFPETRAALLGLCLLNPNRRFFLREIIRRLGSGRSTVQSEVQRLTETGILTSHREGRRLYYQANQESPVYPSLQELLQITIGPVGRIRVVLAPLEQRIDLAFVYGSMARYQATDASDIDLMLIGDIGFGEVCDLLSPAEKQLEREINPSVYPAHEFREKNSKGNSFLRTVRQQPKLFVIGCTKDLDHLDP